MKKYRLDHFVIQRPVVVVCDADHPDAMGFALARASAVEIVEKEIRFLQTYLRRLVVLSPADVEED